MRTRRPAAFPSGSGGLFWRADPFVREERGGANEPRLLDNVLIGVLGHFASYGERGDRHDYAMTFAKTLFMGWLPCYVRDIE
ncbi:DUF1861 family protein [Cohnella sp. REN36]|uniref:DUF1861 family protein n=1 Tax=Cohnella sp. REN36 TaxID=2887347 RepID=UPI001D141B22|nr:DUF1861 family protein [Cohnella sp. REN36]MCC3372590.1 DUF1861 family protein [Cohnella sp. REN36]